MRVFDFNSAIVRTPGKSVVNGLRAIPGPAPVFDSVLAEHSSYISALRDAGVCALKIEGRQRGKAYVAEVVTAMRQTLKAAPEQRAALLSRLRALSEGQQTTSGAYEKRWR